MAQKIEIEIIIALCFSFPNSQSGPQQPPSSSSYPMDNQPMGIPGHQPGMRPLGPPQQHQSSPHPQQMTPQPHHHQQQAGPPPVYSLQNSSDGNSSSIMSTSGSTTPSRNRSHSISKPLPPGSGRGALSAMLTGSATPGKILVVWSYHHLVEVNVLSSAL